MYRLMYRTWRRQCVGPCALILRVWYITTVTFPEPRQHKTVGPRHKTSADDQPIQITQTYTQTQNDHKALTAVLNPKEESHSKEYVNPHDFHYTINNPSVCTDSDLFVLLFVHSAPDHFLERKRIRTT